MRRVGVFFLTLFLILACAGSVTIIAFMLGMVLASLLGLPGAGAARAGWIGANGVFAVRAGLGGLVVGLYGCTSQLYNTFATIA